MSVFQETYNAHIQHQILAQADDDSDNDIDLTACGVVQFLNNQADEMRRLGFKVLVAKPSRLGSAATLSWKLPGAAGHARDEYCLVVDSKGGKVHMRFVGPTPHKTVISLFTRNFDIPTLGRWCTMFYEWALSLREVR